MVEEKPALSLPQALWQKYSTLDDDLPKLNSGNIFIASNAPGKTASGTLRLPPVLAVHDFGITCGGEEGEVSRLCGQVTELDITQNCISQWQEVFKIMQQIPRLTFLNLCNNPLCGDIPAGLDVPSCPQLRHLVLNSTQVPWKTVYNILEQTPNVEELHLSMNNYSGVDQPPRSFPSVKILHFNGNNLQSWVEVCKLGETFPSLVSLVMHEVPLKDIEAPTKQLQETFLCLQKLNISNTGVGSWESLEKFNSLNQLKDVRLLGVPLLDDISDEKLRRQMVIARLPQIVRLNGSSVSEAEREDAERAFIRHFLDSEEKPERYHALVGIHGVLDPLVEVDLTPQTTAHVQVKFEESVKVMDLNVQQTLKEFKRSLKDWTGLPPNKIRVIHINTDLNFDGHICHTEELKYDKNLYSYQIRDGHELLIWPRPPSVPSSPSKKNPPKSGSAPADKFQAKKELQM
ncbi:tubulin-specific chaperone cofactor E-like protein [Branchiostoma floridae x Branchiostoma japonicum]